MSQRAGTLPLIRVTKQGCTILRFFLAKGGNPEPFVLPQQTVGPTADFALQSLHEPQRPGDS